MLALRELDFFALGERPRHLIAGRLPVTRHLSLSGAINQPLEQTLAKAAADALTSRQLVMLLGR